MLDTADSADFVWADWPTSSNSTDDEVTFLEQDYVVAGGDFNLLTGFARWVRGLQGYSAAGLCMEHTHTMHIARAHALLMRMRH